MHFENRILDLITHHALINLLMSPYEGSFWQKKKNCRYSWHVCMTCLWVSSSHWLWLGLLRWGDIDDEGYFGWTGWTLQLPMSLNDGLTLKSSSPCLNVDTGSLFPSLHSPPVAFWLFTAGETCQRLFLNKLILLVNWFAFFLLAEMGFCTFHV